jgi:DUF1365 family protein
VIYKIYCFFFWLNVSPLSTEENRYCFRVQLCGDTLLVFFSRGEVPIFDADFFFIEIAPSSESSGL